MENWEKKVIIADQSGPWCSSLVQQLESTHMPREGLVVTEYGVDVQQALLQETGAPSVVVVAHQLKGMGGLEAIYLAHKLRAAGSGGRPSPMLFLISEVRSDIELLELFRQRGVRSFLYRDDPIKQTAKQILDAHFGEMRRAPRYEVRIPARVELEGQIVTGTIENISSGGCMLSMPASRFVDCPVGHQVGLRFECGGEEIACTAEIRQLGMRKKLLGSTILIGVMFDANNLDMSLKIGAVVKKVALARESPLAWRPDEH